VIALRRGRAVKRGCCAKIALGSGRFTIFMWAAPGGRSCKSHQRKQQKQPQLMQEIPQVFAPRKDPARTAGFMLHLRLLYIMNAIH
jgi:hypothetical protein